MYVSCMVRSHVNELHAHQPRHAMMLEAHIHPPSIILSSSLSLAFRSMASAWVCQACRERCCASMAKAIHAPSPAACSTNSWPRRCRCSVAKSAMAFAVLESPASARPDPKVGTLGAAGFSTSESDGGRGGGGGGGGGTRGEGGCR